MGICLFYISSIVRDYQEGMEINVEISNKTADRIPDEVTKLDVIFY